MPFDNKKDKKLFEKSVGNLTVGVYSYDEGEPKLGMNRFFTDKEGNKKHSKAGRLSWEEVLGLEAALPEIKEAMEKQ